MRYAGGGRPYVGDDVLFVGTWNTFAGQRGRVVENDPWLMVRVEGDTHPMRFDPREVILADGCDEVNMSGAE